MMDMFSPRTKITSRLHQNGTYANDLRSPGSALTLTSQNRLSGPVRAGCVAR